MIRFASVMAAVLIFSSCSGRKHLQPAVETVQPAAAPLGAVIVDEVNDGRTLYLRVVVTLHTRWNPSEIHLAVIGLRDGVVQGTSRSTLAELIPQGSRPPGKPGEYIITLSVPAEGLTDYQLEISWDEPAEALAAADGLVLGQVTAAADPACLGSGCGVRISAELFNGGASSVDRARLYVTCGGAAGTEALEQEVALEHLQLAPGARRSIVLEMELPGGFPADRCAPEVKLLDDGRGE